MSATADESTIAFIYDPMVDECCQYESALQQSVLLFAFFVTRDDVPSQPVMCGGVLLQGV